MHIEPINQWQKNQVISITKSFIDKGSRLYNHQFNYITVQFDLKGRSAGMYRRKNNQSVIRYNPYIFSKYFNENVTDTIPHEVAHYLADQLNPNRKIQPHGAEWKQIMLDLGCNPQRTCHYDLTGIPTRQYKRFNYRCGCTNHQITTRSHNQIQTKKRRYICRLCKEELNYEPET